MNLRTTLRKAFFVLTLLITVSAARAQWVRIPDLSFGTWLYHHGYSTCLSGSSTTAWYLDTTCSPLLNDTLLNITSMGGDLSCIEYFKGLKRLGVSSCSLSSTPSLLPPNITFLDWESVGSSVGIPPFPDSLQTIMIRYNNTQTLPPLPLALLDLTCSDGALDSLPPLPPHLISLDCSNSHLRTLPALPSSLLRLDCNNNNIQNLPMLPPTLAWLNFGANQVTSIPNMPQTITQLGCSYNSGLSCLPELPRYLYSFDIGHTNIRCMPNRFNVTNYYSVDPNSLPLCTPFDGCAFYYNISGNVHQDTSASCLQDSLSNGSPISGVKLQLSSGGTVLGQTYSYQYLSNGYSFKVDSSNSNYTVSVDTTGLPFDLVCPLGLNRSNIVISSSNSIKNQDFGLRCRGIDNGVTYIVGSFRVGLTTSIHINAGDMAAPYGMHCNAHSSGTVSVSLTGSVMYQSARPGALIPSSVAANMLTYNIADFDSIRPGDFDIMVWTDSNATIGSTACVSVTVTTTGNTDINPTNDSLTQCFTVINSYDPNLKTVYPISAVDTGAQWLTYTVSFQNTGNDTAYTVIVKDTLSQYLDAASFQYLASDHNAVIQLFGNAMVFTFPKINLVDSLHNEPLSHGWIQYKVKTIPNLPIGTQIKNTASIYFDLNPTIVTNTTVNTVAIDTAHTHVSIADVDAAHVRIYPNPNSGSFTLETSHAIGEEYIITDMLGQIIQEKGITSDKQHIDMSTNAAGVYALMLRGKTGAVRIIKQ